MRILLLVLMLVSFAADLLSQTRREPYCGFSLRNGYYSQPYRQYVTTISQPGDRYGIADVVEKILETLSVKVTIETYVAKAEDNCYATIRQGRKIIVADVDFLEEVNANSKTQWGAISILAHEVGHHIAGFSRGSDGELDADYWSGYILQKLGASRNASVKCILTYGTERDTSSHPNKYSRSQSIRSGWDDAANGDVDYSRCEDCEPD